MKDIEKQYARVFSTPAGKQVLNHLRSITNERVLGPNIQDTELRWWAGQKALVHQIEMMIKKGNNPT